MTNSNDYFVTFGSDADVFARKIKSEMEKAAGYVDDFIRHVEGKGGAAGELLRGHFANQVGGGGNGGGGTGVAPEILKTAMTQHAEQIHDITAELVTTVAAMKAANASIAEIPTKVSNSIKSTLISVARQFEQATGQGRYEGARGRITETGAPGAIQRGSQQYEILQGLRRYQAQQGGLALAAARGTQTPTDIKSIGAHAIDRANFDRVINAIRAQTRVMASGTPVRLQGGGGGAGGAVPVNVVAAEGRPVTAAVAPTATAAEDLTPAQKAAAAKAEREASGLSRTEQTAARRQAADEARAARPVLTTDEVADRLRRTAAIATAGADDFAYRAQGRYSGEAGNKLSAGQLEEMAKAFDSVGIVVKRTTKTTKEQMASLLQEAHQAYQLIYPEGHEALRTKGFNVQSTTKIADEVAGMLGDLGPRVAERLHANAVLEADRQAGGVRQQAVERGTPQPGAIVVPPGMVKGRLQTGLGNDEEVKAARALIAPDAEREMSRVMELAKSANFQPYVSGSSAVKPGNAGPEEAALAQAARDALRDTQLATQALDAMGKEFLDLTEAMVENADLIRRREKVLESLQSRDYQGPEGATDRARREGATGSPGRAGPDGGQAQGAGRRGPCGTVRHASVPGRSVGP